jgi:hypothetical protein
VVFEQAGPICIEEAPARATKPAIEIETRMLERSAGVRLGAPAGTATDVVEGAQHRRNVAQRGPVRAPLVDRAKRVPLEVDDPVAVRSDEHLSQVVIPVGADDLRGGRDGIEQRQSLGDRGRELAERCTCRPGRDLEGALEFGMPGDRPVTQFLAGREAWCHLREAVAVCHGGVQSGGQRPEIRGDLGRVLDTDLARHEQPGGQRLGDRLVRVGGIGDEGLGHRHREGAVPGVDQLREAGQRRDRRESGLLGQECGHLQVGVEAGLEPAERLEQNPLAEHDRGVALVRAEFPFRARVIRAHRDRGTADEHRGGGGRRVRFVREGGHHPAVRHRDRERAPRAIAGHRFPERVAGQGERVALRRTVVEGHRCDGEHVRAGLVEDERRLEPDGLDRAALGREPASSRDGASVQAREGSLDGAPIGHARGAAA